MLGLVTDEGADFLQLCSVRVSFCPKQEEMCRIEEEQSFEELKILRELVHDRFYKQEELAEVRSLLRRGRSGPVHSEPFGINMRAFLSDAWQWQPLAHHSPYLPLCDYTESSRASV